MLELRVIEIILLNLLQDIAQYNENLGVTQCLNHMEEVLSTFGLSVHW